MTLTVLGTLTHLHLSSEGGSAGKILSFPYVILGPCTSASPFAQDVTEGSKVRRPRPRFLAALGHRQGGRSALPGAHGSVFKGDRTVNFCLKFDPSAGVRDHRSRVLLFQKRNSDCLCPRGGPQAGRHHRALLYITWQSGSQLIMHVTIPSSNQLPDAASRDRLLSPFPANFRLADIALRDVSCLPWCHPPPTVASVTLCSVGDKKTNVLV